MQLSKIFTALAVSALLCYGLTACNKPAVSSGNNGASVPSKTIAAADPQPAGSATAGEAAAATASEAGGKCAECLAAGKDKCTCAAGGCKDANCTSCPAKDPGAAAPAGSPAGSDEAGIVKLADGSSVQVINVGLLDGDYKNHAGLVAIDGEVAQVFADRGTFMLKNCPPPGMKADGCSKPCCAEAQIPIKLDMTQYSGTLPQTGAGVVVIGDVSLTATGYTLAVREVRSGDQVILSRIGEKNV